jgi:hypothetical protein
MRWRFCVTKIALKFGLTIILLASMTLAVSCSSGISANKQALVSQTSNLVSGITTVKAQGYYDNYFSIDAGAMQNVTVSGSFKTSGGSGNDVEVFIMDDQAFTNWSNGQKVSALYDSGQTTAGNIDTRLSSSGIYHLVLSNTFSMIASKDVTADIDLNWSQSK